MFEPRKINGQWRVVYIRSGELATDIIFDSYEDADEWCLKRELDRFEPL